MTDYVALLRGVMPGNAKMGQLREAFEAAGWKGVRTVLSSGNVLFSRKPASESALEREVESVLLKHLRREFFTIIRSIESLRKLLDSNPYDAYRLKPGSKRVVTFLRAKPESPVALPIEEDGARILALGQAEVFSAYVPSPRGPVFMTLIEKTFGKNLTTRTWDTIARIARS